MSNLLELVMIVKNSGEILRKCLQKNRNFIDHWTIVDTGSTDNTPDIIRTELEGIPGTLHFAEFTNFAETRNKAFELADKKCKYMIVLDDSYEIGNGKEMCDYLQKSKADVILSKIAFKKENVLTDLYYSHRISRSTSGLRYKYRVHEILDIPPKVMKKKNETVDETRFYIIDHSTTEHGSRTQARHKRDIEHLLLDLQESPNDPRLVYYLAVTSANMGETEETNTAKYLKKLLEMTNVKEYAYYAEYHLILQNYVKTDDRATYQKKLMNLQHRYLDRAEPSYKLAVSFYEEGQLDKINMIMDRLIQVPLPQLGMTHLEHDVYEYQIPYLYCEVKFKLGLVEKGVTVLKSMLEQCPSDQKLLNMKYAICDNLDKGHTRLAPKTLVIHTGEIPFTWNPALPIKISGSEYMAMNMAKEFRDLGYRVFVFGCFEDEEDKKIDYQTTIEGIQYIDNIYFSDFCLTYIVDQLIVSRYIDNLVYYNNVKNVHLWLHDILPNGDFRFIQIHKEKFKGVICISEWQKRYVMKHTKIDGEAIYVSRNAIHPKRFNGPVQVERTPFRFVFTSDPNRGFNNFVDMIPWIKERYPQSTFYLFGKLEQISDEDMATVKAMSEYVFLSHRVTQDQLAIELKKSDVWLYPTCFDETYCISAVEAMAAGCLVASINEAALCEIVGDRGVMVDYTTREETNRALFEALCKVLDDPKKKEEITERGHEWSMKQDYYTLALDWKKKLF